MLLLLAKNNNLSYADNILHINKQHFSDTLYGANTLLTSLCRYILDNHPINSFYCCNLSDAFHMHKIIPQINALEDLFFIVPIDINPLEMCVVNDETIFLFDYLAKYTSDIKIILSTAHADQFSNFSHYVSTANQIAYKTTYQMANSHKIMFVANHLKDSGYANIDASCALICAQTGKAPQFDNNKISETYLEFEEEDFDFPIAFFKHGTLKNFYTLEKKPQSVVNWRTIRAIQKELDHRIDYLRGQRYSSQTLFVIKEHVSHVMNSKQHNWFVSWKLLDIIINKGDIEILIEILPYYSIETVQVKIIALV